MSARTMPREPSSLPIMMQLALRPCSYTVYLNVNDMLKPILDYLLHDPVVFIWNIVVSFMNIMNNFVY